MTRNRVPRRHGPTRRFAVFLDRDGVVNRPAPEGAYIEQRADFEMLPGVSGALRVLHEAGATIFVVTNQRGVARGIVDAGELDAMHAEMTALLAREGIPLGGVYVCPHEADTCDCRKPGTGLFRQAVADHPWIDFASAELIGDSLSDMRAGHALGVRSWVVGHNRMGVVSAAGALDISIAGSAESLAALVADPEFRAAVVP